MRHRYRCDVWSGGVIVKRLFTSLFTKTPEAATAQVLADIKAIQERNAKRIEQIKIEMGERWVLHPSHKKSRLDTPRPV